MRKHEGGEAKRGPKRLQSKCKTKDVFIRNGLRAHLHGGADKGKEESRKLGAKGTWKEKWGDSEKRGGGPLKGEGGVLFLENLRRVRLEAGEKSTTKRGERGIKPGTKTRNFRGKARGGGSALVEKRKSPARGMVALQND